MTWCARDLFVQFGLLCVTLRTRTFCRWHILGLGRAGMSVERVQLLGSSLRLVDRLNVELLLLLLRCQLQLERQMEEEGLTWLLSLLESIVL